MHIHLNDHVVSIKHADNAFVLHEGVKVSSTQPPMPESRSDILEFDAQREGHVCRLLGVPESMAAGGKRKAQQAATHVDNNDFKYFQGR